jgi:hypothetical protein
MEGIFVLLHCGKRRAGKAVRRGVENNSFAALARPRESWLKGVVVEVFGRKTMGSPGYFGNRGLPIFGPQNFSHASLRSGAFFSLPVR